MNVSGYAAQSADTPAAPWEFERRDPRPDDVVIDMASLNAAKGD